MRIPWVRGLALGIALATLLGWLLLSQCRRPHEFRGGPLRGEGASAARNSPILVGHKPRQAEDVAPDSSPDVGDPVTDRQVSIRLVGPAGNPLLRGEIEGRAGVDDVVGSAPGRFTITWTKGVDIFEVTGRAPGHWPDGLFVPVHKVQPGAVLRFKLRYAPSLRVLDPSGNLIPTWYAVDSDGRRLTMEETVQLIPSRRVVVSAPGYLPLSLPSFSTPDVCILMGLSEVLASSQEVRDLYLVPNDDLPLCTVYLDGVDGDVFYRGSLERSDQAFRSRLAHAVRDLPPAWAHAYLEWFGSVDSDEPAAGCLVRTGDHSGAAWKVDRDRPFDGVYPGGEPLVILGDASGKLRLWPTDCAPLDVSFDTASGPCELRYAVTRSPWSVGTLVLGDGCSELEPESAFAVQIMDPFRGRHVAFRGGKASVALPSEIGQGNIVVWHPGMVPVHLSVEPGERRTVPCDAREHLVRLVLGALHDEGYVVSKANLGGAVGSRVVSAPEGGSGELWKFCGVPLMPALNIHLDLFNYETQKVRRLRTELSTADWGRASAGEVHVVAIGD